MGALFQDRLADWTVGLNITSINPSQGSSIIRSNQSNLLSVVCTKK
jgi:hypothetical protein